MVECDWCKKNMGEVDSCEANKFVEFPDGTKLPSSTYHFDERNGRCHDCNIKHGGYHHPGCDVERCPKCGGQLISCDCLLTKEEQDEFRMAISSSELDKQ